VAAEELGYRPALDGIRCLAITLVLGLHYFNFPPGGAVGVDLFFVLSGFLITTLVLEERTATGRFNLVGFYVRRARRLFPALAVVITIYLIATAAAGQNNLLPAVVGVFYLANIAGAAGSHMLGDANLFGLWSLAQEEQFYLVWPSLLLLVARSRRALGWIIAAMALVALWRSALILHGAPDYRIFDGPDVRSSALLAGSALAIWRQRHPSGVGEWAGKVGLVGVGLGASLGWTWPGWPLWCAPLFEVSAVLFIAAAVSKTELARGLAVRPLVWVGRRSYSLYLWHFQTPFGLGFLLRETGVRVPLFDGKLIALGAAFAAAALSYRFVEQPFRARRRPRIAPAVAEAAA
jgi:peptidoglycan/LPS O-acetylase OafA/YrhL